MIPSLCDIEKAIGIPAKKWSKRCYEISCAILNSGIIDGLAVYGHYNGLVVEGSPFYKKTFIRHGWIVTPDGKIIDPTRWVFECVEPYIFVAKESHPDYDRGGEAFRNFFQSVVPIPVPEFNPESKVIFELEDEEYKLLFSAILGLDDVCDRVCVEQFFWAANRPLGTLKDMAKPLYIWLEEKGYSGFIPIDYRIIVLGQKKK